MKKIIFTTVLTLIMVGGMRLTATAQETKYYVVCGTVRERGMPDVPYVSNVARASCRFHNAQMARNQMNDYLKAFVLRRIRYTDSNPGNCHAYEFDTRDQAEKKRRELIASYNGNTTYNYADTFIINDFRVLCDDR